MKKAIVAVVVLILLVAGGLGGAAILGVGPLTSLFGSGGKAAEEAPSAPQPTPAAGRKFPMATFIIPIIEKRTLRRQVAMDLELQVNPAAGDKVATLMPRLYDAYYKRLYEIVPRHSDPQSAADTQIIHDELTKVADRVLGEGIVREVVIKSIYER
jgi:hypothetical protein